VGQDVPEKKRRKRDKNSVAKHAERAGKSQKLKKGGTQSRWGSSERLTSGDKGARMDNAWRENTQFER
jgi:hypothetical protein